MSAYEADTAAEPTIAGGSVPILMTTQEALDNLELVTDGARRLLESECAALAAKLANPAQIRRMKAALTAMDRDRRRSMMPIENDRRFHLEVADASGNSALALAVRTLWEQRAGPLFVTLEHHFDTPDLWTAAIDEHVAVLNAIEKHDPSAARAAMRRHMDRAAKRFQRSWSAGGRTGADT